MSRIIEQAIKNLSQGEVIGFPTDTVYGIACDASSNRAVKKLYEIKNRAAEKPLQIMVATLAEAEKLGIFNDAARDLAKKYWPGALTLVVKKASTVIPGLTGDPASQSALDSRLRGNDTGGMLAKNISIGDTVGIRIPNDGLILQLLQAYAKPLAATSANISGAAAALDSVEAEKILGDKISYYIPGASGSGQGSTVVDLTGIEPIVLRQGEVKL